MQEATCNFLNTNKRARQKVHQTYVGADATIHIFSLLLVKAKVEVPTSFFGVNTSYIHRAS